MSGCDKLGNVPQKWRRLPCPVQDGPTHIKGAASSTPTPIAGRHGDLPLHVERLDHHEAILAVWIVALLDVVEGEPMLFI